MFRGSGAIGIVLSGNAADGSQGVRAIKAECGLIFAQDEASARFGGMPRNAVATGAADYILSPTAMALELARVSRHPFVVSTTLGESDLPEGEQELDCIFKLLEAATNVDFAHYKRKTVRRRIGRRMIVHRTKTLAEYVRVVREQPEELRKLHRDLLISVTSFFRDAHSFEALFRILKEVLPQRGASGPLRMWVPGCATGEEAFSLAIGTHELLEELKLPFAVQIFGTDISEVALERARSGIYGDNALQDLSPERLNRYFTKCDGGFQVNKLIRDMCVFALQDVISDPPFRHTDLVSCRNLLIYMDASLQRRVVPSFHYSLNPTGLLMLGSTESIHGAHEYFASIDDQHPIYRRRAVPVRVPFSWRDRDMTFEEAGRLKDRSAISSIELQRRADRIIQDKYSPPALIVDKDLKILQFRGNASAYLEPSPGEASLNLLRMVNEGLAVPLRRLMRAALEQKTTVRQSGVRLSSNGDSREVNLEIVPVRGASPEELYYLIIFEESQNSVNGAAPVETLEVEGDTTGQAAGLTHQLGETRESLRTLIEDQEARNAELRGANEELKRANEELQSTKEELSAAKGELQSATEELTTLNEELQNRSEELHATNSDLVNLLAAVDIPIIMVDNGLRIRRFNAAAERQLDLKGVDVGRGVGLVGRSLNIHQLEPLSRKVLDTLTPEQTEAQNAAGQWFSLSIRPYRSLDNRNDGAVVVFFNIDLLKKSLETAEEARDYAEGMIETVQEPLLTLDSEFRVLRATSSFYETFQISREETVGQSLFDLGSGQWNTPRLRELLNNAMFRNQAFQELEIRCDFPHLGKSTMRLAGRRIPKLNDQQETLLLAIKDTTQRREEAEIRYSRLFETAKDGMLVLNAETRLLTDVNPYFLELSGYPREHFIGRPLELTSPFEDKSMAAAVVDETFKQDIVRRDEVSIRSASGQALKVEMVANRYLVGSQQVVQINVRDVTARERAAVELRESEGTLRLLIDSVRDYALFQIDLDRRVATWNSGAQRLLGYEDSQIIGQPVAILFTAEDRAKGEDAGEIRTANAHGRSEDERWHVRIDGSRFFADGVLTTIQDESGNLCGYVKVMRDITQRREAQQMLEEQAELLDLTPATIMVRQLDGTIHFWSQGAQDMYGYTKSEAVGVISHSLLKTVFPTDGASMDRELMERGRWEGELIHTSKDGRLLTVASRWALLRHDDGQGGRVLEINSDISSLRRVDQQLRSSLAEKEVLLREIHHRVKNNLQMIASLLSLQSEFVGNSEALALLDEMHTRVRSIATIHEMLYGANDFSRIDFNAYLTLLAKDLSAFYGFSTDRIHVETDQSGLALNISQAIPGGLIVNELLTNSLKHAFPEGQAGKIEVVADCSGPICKFEVFDNGVGLPANLAPESAQTMGLQLVNLLVEQLNGSLEIQRDGGTRFTVRFPRKQA